MLITSLNELSQAYLQRSAFADSISDLLETMPNHSIHYDHGPFGALPTSLSLFL